MQKKTLTFLIVLGVGYFLLFWFPNATGAHDQNMISIFSSDEFAQYPHAARMLEPGKTFPQSLYRFFAYQHYYYGFPFYFYSAVVALLPIKLISGASSVSLNMLLLREIVSVLPMIVALIVLVGLQTNFDFPFKSLFLFLFLLSIPGVVANDLWWHPESLVFFFIVLTIYFLYKDNLSFEKFFYFSAIACGLAVAIKLVGLFFIFTIPAYIFIGWLQKRVEMRKAIFVAFLFVVIMLVTFVLSNPFLFWASERTQAFKIQTQQAEASSTGFVLTYHNSPLSWLSVITNFYGLPAFLLLSLVALIVGLLKGEKRLLNFLILSWALPFTIYLFAVVVIRPKHYFLPILLPIFSALPAYFLLVMPAQFTRPLKDYFRKNGLRLLLFIFGILIVGWQVIYNLGSDIAQIQTALNREKDNRILQFYSGLEQNYLSRFVLDRQLVVYRDVQMYIPDVPAYNVKFHWGTIDYSYIQKVNADLLVLSKQHLRDFTQEGVQQRALNPDFSSAYQFYKDALGGNVASYTLLYQDEVGVAYLSTSLYDQFFISH